MKNRENRMFRVTWGKYYKGDPILSTTHGTEEILAPSAGDAMDRIMRGRERDVDWAEAVLKSEE